MHQTLVVFGFTWYTRDINRQVRLRTCTGRVVPRARLTFSLLLVVKCELVSLQCGASHIALIILWLSTTELVGSCPVHE